jgi:hypothetical protein
MSKMKPCLNMGERPGPTRTFDCTLNGRRTIK